MPQNFARLAVVAEDELSYISALDDDSQLSQLSGVGLLDTSAELASLATDGEALSFEMALREWQVPVAPLRSPCTTSSHRGQACACICS